MYSIKMLYLTKLVFWRYLS